MEARDGLTFPALDSARRRQRTPLAYFVLRRPHLTEIRVDGFFIPHDVAERLSALYRDYVDWWLNTPERRWFPRGGIGMPDFVDFVSVVVLREHSEWWITLFNEAGTLTYNAWDRANAAWRTGS